MKRLAYATAGLLTLMLAAAPPLGAQQARPRNDTEKNQEPAKGSQARPQQRPQAVPQRRRIEQREQQQMWRDRRAQNWGTEHRGWRERGGYHGYRIPDSRFQSRFGNKHYFRLYNQPMMIVGRYPRFQHEGYWFTVMDPWPESWTNDWYQNDDVYVGYTDDGYYLYNRSYPETRLALEVHAL
jgi:hypothetical protein